MGAAGSMYSNMPYSIAYPGPPTSNLDLFSTPNRTPWVKIWAPWHMMQPYEAAPTGNESATLLVDQQVNAAHSQGFAIILTSIGFPYWTNPSLALFFAAVPGAPNSEAIYAAGQWQSYVLEREYQYWDRYSKSDWAAYACSSSLPAVTSGNWKPRADFAHAVLGPHGRGCQNRIPDDNARLGLDPATSNWGYWVGWLLDRYGDRIFGLEICNEPNYELWPQWSPPSTTPMSPSNPLGAHGCPTSDSTADQAFTASGTLQVTCKINQMIQTAVTVRNDPHRIHGRTPLLGPATSDYQDTSTDFGRHKTSYHTFTQNLLSQMTGWQFHGDDRFIWSHHNYSDILMGNSGQTLRSGYVQSLLSSAGWWGYSDPSFPGDGLWLTEGGVSAAACQDTYITPQFTGSGAVRPPSPAAWAKQADLMSQAIQAVSGNDQRYPNGGYGIGMFMWFLTYDSDAYGTGLRNPTTLGGGARPCWTNWCNFRDSSW